MSFFSTNVTRFAGFFALAAALVVSGCQATDAHPQENTTAALPDAADLRNRAEALWKARVTKDWRTAYEFVDPAVKAESTVESYVDFKTNKEPFIYRSYELGRVETEEQLGWVEVTHESTLRPFPDAPPRRTNRWEKWQVVGKEWYPVPRGQYDGYPACPVVRDRAREAQLARRFEEALELLKAEDLSTLYMLISPEDRENLTEAEFVETEKLHQTLSADVRWVEVIGERGRIGVIYQQKVNDPSMKKMPPQPKSAIEAWVLHDDKWYRDIQTESH
jgi:hypothetical protein